MDKSEPVHKSEPDVSSTPVQIAISPDEKKQRMRRNRAIGLMVLGFVVLIYLVTILRLGASVQPV